MQWKVLCRGAHGTCETLYLTEICVLQLSFPTHLISKVVYASFASRSLEMTVLLRVECADGIIPVRRDIFIQADLTWDDALLAHCIEKLLGLAPGHIRMYIFDASAGGKTEIVKDATLAAQNVTADSRLYIERVGEYDKSFARLTSAVAMAVATPLLHFA